MSEENNKPKQDKEKNLILDDERDLLMDHEYDGIQELDNNMPPWWLWGFYFTIALAVVYLFYYEVSGWGPTQEEQYEIEMAMAAERYGTTDEIISDFAQAQILTDMQSIERGREIYSASTNLCATCHGAQGQGLVGPNLTDNYWKHGCDFQSIITSIKDGFPAQGMPPYGSTVRIADDDLIMLASYIMYIRGSEPDNPRAPNMSRAVECVEELPEDHPAEED